MCRYVCRYVCVLSVCPSFSLSLSLSLPMYVYLCLYVHVCRHLCVLSVCQALHLSLYPYVSVRACVRAYEHVQLSSSTPFPVYTSQKKAAKVSAPVIRCTINGQWPFLALVHSPDPPGLNSSGCSPEQVRGEAPRSVQILNEHYPAAGWCPCLF